MNTNTGNEETQTLRAVRNDIANRSHIDSTKQGRKPDRADRRVLFQDMLEQLLGVRACASDKSISERIFSHCEYMRYSSVKCPQCGGAGIVGPTTQRQQDEILARIAEWRDANPGAKHRGEALPREYGCECGKCRGTGHLEITELERTEWPRFVGKAVEREGNVTKIIGDWVFDRQTTVEPGTPMSSASPVEPDVAVQFAQASRVLNSVARKSMLSAVALGAYYGPPGNRWEKASRYGRLFALFPLTDAGSKLLHRTRKLAGEETPWSRIHSLMALTNVDVVLLLKQAYEQAVRVLENSADLWDAEMRKECAQR